jgi:hypothetical protein
LKRVLDPGPQLLTFFAHHAGLCSRRSELIPQALDLTLKLAHSRVRTGRGALRLRQLKP